MGFLEGLNISASALSAERVRMNVIASNLANASTTRTDEGGPYKRKDVVFTTNNKNAAFENLLNPSLDSALKEVFVTEIVEDKKSPHLVFNPNHPDANQNGYVAMPNISVMEEMVNMITSNRAFESNTQVINTIKNMAMSAINIGR